MKTLPLLVILLGLFTALIMVSTPLLTRHGYPIYHIKLMVLVSGSLCIIAASWVGYLRFYRPNKKSNLCNNKGSLNPNIDSSASSSKEVPDKPCKKEKDTDNKSKRFHNGIIGRSNKGVNKNREEPKELKG